MYVFLCFLLFNENYPENEKKKKKKKKKKKNEKNASTWNRTGDLSITSPAFNHLTDA